MKKIVSFVLAAILLTGMLFVYVPGNVWAGQTRENVTVYVNGEKHIVRGLNHEYENNLYLSLKDLANAVNNTSKAFELQWKEIDGDTVAVLSKVEAGMADTEERVFEIGESEDDNKVNHSRKRTHIYIDDNDYYLYAFPVKEDDKNDCYVNCGELALAMNMDISCMNNEVYINTNNEFDFNKMDLNESGLPFMADSCLVGDVTTGKIYYSMNENEVVAIASTSKLMTYLIIKDAIEAGKISEDDTVTFSKKASELSKTSNGVIHVEPDKRAAISDVLKGMLIVSSNECALALAEHCSGSEEAFVELMNQKVKALGLSEEARFYNPHGLPVYLDDALTIKQSNHLTANDMFMLSAHILKTYPEITDITSIKKANLASFSDFKAANTNALLYNVPGTVGLKTGTTDKASSCLVSAYEAEDAAGDTHYIVAIVYGAENAQTQGYVSMLLMRYGIQAFNASELGIVPESEALKTVPEDLEGLVGAVMSTARRNSRK